MQSQVLKVACVSITAICSSCLTVTVLGQRPVEQRAVESQYARSVGEGLSGVAENVPLTFSRITRSSAQRGDELDEGWMSRGAYRDDGSWAMATYGLDDDGVATESRVILDLQGARHVLVDSGLRSVTSTQLSDEAVQRRGTRPGCDGEIVGTFLGHEVTRRATPPILMSGRQIRIEALHAPALGCLEMEKRVTATYADGTEHLTQLEQVIDVRIGQPGAGWFSVPSDYVELSPEERMVILHGVDDLTGDSFVQAWERSYRESQRGVIRQ